MSFLYRPTPVVNLGNGPFASSRVINGWTGATMRGIPAGASALGKASPTGAASRSRRVNTAMQPWIQMSGTMGRFVPNGLGQDDGSDWSTAGDVAPILPDVPPLSPDLVPPDLSSSTFSPNLPALIPVAGPAAPAPFDTTMISAPTTLTPPAGAGPTGTGIPGTQPTNRPAFLPSTQSSAISSILNNVKSFFAPSTPPAYKALPGYGGGAAVVPPAAASVLPGVSNTALLIGVAAFVVVLGMGASGGGRR
jgi:hypothetical protein